MQKKIQTPINNCQDVAVSKNIPYPFFLPIKVNHKTQTKVPRQTMRLSNTTLHRSGAEAAKTLFLSHRKWPEGAKLSIMCHSKSRLLRREEFLSFPPSKQHLNLSFKSRIVRLPSDDWEGFPHAFLSTCEEIGLDSVCKLKIYFLRIYEDFTVGDLLTSLLAPF